MVKKIRLATLLYAVLYIFVIASFVQSKIVDEDSTSRSERIDKLFDFSDSDAIPGASVIVIQQGEILYKKAYGFANIEQKIPNTPQTIFRLGSVTKQFTAMAILQLHDKQLLQIDDTLEKYFPNTKNGAKITIRNLLTHTSGIGESLDSALEFSPGDQISYSNTGYNLLGKIIEDVSGSSYFDYLRENIFNPLGMNNTGYEQQDNIIKSMACGYKMSDDNYPKNVSDSNASGAYAAGALCSTIEDMYIWDQALYAGTLVKRSTLNQAFSPAVLNDGNKTHYGFGWMINQYKGLREIAHGGDIAGFNSYIARFPDENFSVIVLSNIEMRPSGPLASAKDLTHSITDIYLSDRMTTVKDHPAKNIDKEILERYIGAYKLINAPAPVIEASGDIYTIVKKSNLLYVQSKLGEQEIHSLTETQFYLDNNTTIEFRKDDRKIIGMTIDLMGLGVRIIKADKIE